MKLDKKQLKSLIDAYLADDTDDVEVMEANAYKFAAIKNKELYLVEYLRDTLDSVPETAWGDGYIGDRGGLYNAHGHLGVRRNGASLLFNKKADLLHKIVTKYFYANVPTIELGQHTMFANYTSGKRRIIAALDYVINIQSRGVV